MAWVLVVEDDPAVAEVVAGCLRRAGFEVDAAADGHAALAAAIPELPDLVVLDLMLPARPSIPTSSPRAAHQMPPCSNASSNSSNASAVI